jgi:hypothetical protein
VPDRCYYTVVNFCTVASIEFLPPLLVAQQSLATTQADAFLDVLCMDAETTRALEQLNLERVRLTPIGDLERADPELAQTKAGRLVKEYCWTAKPAFLRYLFELHPEIERLTFIDSDLEFYGDLEQALLEEGEAPVFVYPQRMVAGWKKGRDRHNGDFNSGTVTFRRSEDAFAALAWWRERCIEWCYARYEEPDRWGDQKYLQTMARLFPTVKPAANPALGVAPWNTRYRKIEEASGQLVVDGAPIVFYHFASLRLYGGLTMARRLGLFANRFRDARGGHPFIWRAWEEKRLTSGELELLWHPYVRRLGAAMAVAQRIEPKSVSIGNARRLLLNDWLARSKGAARS